MNQKQANQVKDLAKSCNDVLEKLEWKWKPRMGEWFVGLGFKPRLVLGTDSDYEYIIFLDKRHHQLVRLLKYGYIPILHWEEIEKILEGMGYWANLYLGAKEWWCRIKKESHCYGEEFGKTRQEAVMKAVIKLGEAK